MALKNILNVPRLTPTERIHTQLKQDMLGTRRQKHTATIMYEIRHDTAPSQLKDMFTKLSQIHDRQTRINRYLNNYVPRMNLGMSKRNIKYRGVKFWEMIPDEVKLAPSKKAFKRAMDMLW